MKHFSIAAFATLLALFNAEASELKLKKEHHKLARQVVSEYADLAHALYVAAISDAKSLQTALKNFTAAPTEASFSAAKTAWKQARASYSRTEALRFYGGPIDNAENGPEGLLNAWPLDEAYLDYVKGQAKAGLVQNPKAYPQITKELLLSMNEKDGEKNISTGYHAIEFLLWGQDFSTTGPGARALSDYVLSKKSPHAERRAVALNLLAELIIEHLEGIGAQWNPKAQGTYRTAFLKEPLDEALRKIFTGITSLSVDEMAGERLTVALEINDQENEQDCFSDYSLQDSNHNQEGIAAVVSGTSLLKLIEKQNADQATAIVAALAKPTQLTNEAMKIGDFDKIISDKSEKSAGRKKIREVIAALNHQGVELAKAGKAMGLVLNIETEENESH